MFRVNGGLTGVQNNGCIDNNQKDGIPVSLQENSNTSRSSEECNSPFDGFNNTVAFVVLVGGEIKNVEARVSSLMVLGVVDLEFSFEMSTTLGIGGKCSERQSDCAGRFYRRRSMWLICWYINILVGVLNGSGLGKTC